MRRTRAGGYRVCTSVDWTQTISEGAEEETEGSGRVTAGGDQRGSGAGGGLNAEVVALNRGPSDTHREKSLQEKHVG